MNVLLLLSLSLIGWAWLLNTWIATAVLLLLILLSKLSHWRWQLTLSQFYRWGDLSSLLLILLLAYLHLLQNTDRPIFIVLKWLPMLFAPVLLAQLFSSSQNLPLGTLFYSFRKRSTDPPQTLDFQLPYVALTLLSAGAANVANLNYFMLVVALFIGILWTARPKHSPVWLWLLLITLAIPLGHVGQFGLRRLQNIIEYQTINWLGSWHTDPFKTRTSIGDVGEMKLSDKIAFRVKTDMPIYLLQASYDRYLSKTWVVSNATFTEENPVKAKPAHLLQKLEIIQQFSKQDAILALPDGTFSIIGMEGADFEYHPLGAVKIGHAPEVGRYQVFFTGVRTDAPSDSDVQIPKRHAVWLAQLAKKLQLNEKTPTNAIQTIKSYFRSNFRYSLYLGKEPDADLALKEFMFNRKAGHCEYFAAATVFLLRQAKIPARFVNGFVAEEYDPEQNLYIVRYRHAHAWAIAYLNGAWQIVDTTPSQWLEMENEQAGLLQPLNDWFSNRLLAFKQWQMEKTEQQPVFVLWAAGLMAAYIGWRIYSARRQLTRQDASGTTRTDVVANPGWNSEFYLIVQHFQNSDYAKTETESVRAWVQRLPFPELRSLYQAHYQLRFDPHGLSSEQRAAFAQQVRDWLKIAPVKNEDNLTAKH